MKAESLSYQRLEQRVKYLCGTCMHFILSAQIARMQLMESYDVTLLSRGKTQWDSIINDSLQYLLWTRTWNAQDACSQPISKRYQTHSACGPIPPGTRPLSPSLPLILLAGLYEEMNSHCSLPQPYVSIGMSTEGLGDSNILKIWKRF